MQATVRPQLTVRDMRSPSDPHGGYVTEIAFSADGDHLLVGTACFAVRVWGALSGEVMLFCPPLVSIFHHIVHAGGRRLET